MFPLISVSSGRSLNIEPLGTKPKFWYRDGERLMLFKAEERGTGDDWAEKIACELCTLLGLPHIHYELAVLAEGDTPGVVCESCVPAPTQLILGNQLMLDRDPSYPTNVSKYKVKAHTVEAVSVVIEGLEPPTSFWMGGVPAGIESSLDVFVGYAMLDA